jgi:hypothetical protein
MKSSDVVVPSIRDFGSSMTSANHCPRVVVRLFIECAGAGSFGDSFAPC